MTSQRERFEKALLATGYTFDAESLKLDAEHGRYYDYPVDLAYLMWQAAEADFRERLPVEAIRGAAVMMRKLTEEAKREFIKLRGPKLTEAQEHISIIIPMIAALESLLGEQTEAAKRQEKE